MQSILACIQCLCDIEGKDGAPNQFLGIFGVIEGNGGIGADPLKLQEVALAFLGLGYESLLIDGGAMQVAVSQLAIAVVVVEIVRYIDFCWDGIMADETMGCPIIVEGDCLSVAFWFWCREADAATPHRDASGEGNAPLTIVVHGTIEVIDHAIAL